MKAKKSGNPGQVTDVRILLKWSRARVNIDYHIAFDMNYYSVPYNLVQELVEVRSVLPMGFRIRI